MTNRRIAFRGNSIAAFALLLAVAASSSAFAKSPAAGTAQQTSGPTLSAFHSDAELRDFLKKHRTPRRGLAMDMAMPAQPAGGVQAESVAAPAEKAAGITNNQESGVDEGDIVKLHRDTMVILRRGRLFTVSLAGGSMQPVDSINAYPPGVDARDDWYDEMLMAGNRIVVIGYSYSRGGTEINRFRINDDGRLSFEDSYQLRSNDYYSSRNYASRLVGHNLIFYSPLYIPWSDDPLEALPALRRWTGDPNSGFKRIAGAQQVYIPASLRDSSDMSVDALHTVTTCDLLAPVLDCTAMSVLGPNSRTFYVSARAVYVWVTDWRTERATGARTAASLVYRLPLDGAKPTAVGARGAPVDQFSFREDGDMLNVLVHAESGGDAMWNPEFTQGAVALAAIPLQSFGDGGSEVPAWRYRELPRLAGYDFHNRFVGDYVLYGTGNDWGAPDARNGLLVAAPVRGGAPAMLRLGHGIDRIEAMGRDAVVIGGGAHELDFDAIELTAGMEPRLGDRYALEASQAETRSHAFFFRPDPAQRTDDGTSGVLGLPVARTARPAFHQLFENSAAMIFLRRENRAFSPLGELDAATSGIVDDNCVASCVDWYGNARPIFVGSRIFALLGYELVEGAFGEGSIHEIARVSFAPGAERAERSPPS